MKTVGQIKVGNLVGVKERRKEEKVGGYGVF